MVAGGIARGKDDVESVGTLGTFVEQALIFAELIGRHRR